MIIGLGIVVIGIIWLLSANGLLNSHAWDVIWALVVIGLGVWLIIRSQRERPWWRIFDNQDREDWERWGREFGSRMESWGKSIGREASENSKSMSRDISRQIEDSLRNMFKNKPAADANVKDSGQPVSNQGQYDR